MFQIVAKLWKFLMFVLPFTQSKVKDARVVMDAVDEALSMLQNQQGAISGDLAAQVEELSKAKEVADREIAKADALRKVLTQ